MRSQRVRHDWETEHTHVKKKSIIIKTSSVYRSQTVMTLHLSLIFMVGGLVAKSCPTFATPRTVAHQALLSMGFFRQEYRSGLPWPSPRHPPNPGIKSRSPSLQADALPTELWGKPCYSCHLFLVSSASVRFIPFLSFIEPIFAWNVPLLSLIFLKQSLLLLLLSRFSRVWLCVTP